MDTSTSSRNRPDPALLPDEADQSWIVGQIERCVKVLGWEPVLRSVLVKADADYFPDRWVAGVGGVRRLLSRLWLYAHGSAKAAVPEIRVVVQPRDLQRRDLEHEKPDAERGRQLDAWLLAWESGEAGRPGRLKVGIEASVLGDPLRTVAGLARVVAQVRALELRLVRNARAHFEPAIDMLGLALGFGVLTVNASEWRMSDAPGQSPGVLTGATNSKMMAFGLAVISRLRGHPARAQAMLGDALAPNQKAFFGHATRALAEGVAVGTRQLSAPALEDWPPPRDLDAILDVEFAVDDESDSNDEREVVDEAGSIVGTNAGKPVFIVERSMAKRVFKFSLGLAFLSGMMLRSNQNVEIDTTAVLLWSVGGVAVLTFLARFIRERRCSDPKCDARLERDMTTCPRCGGDVRGVINDPNRRLEMEEAIVQADSGA